VDWDILVEEPAVTSI